MTVRIIHAACLEALVLMPPGHFDACVTDPPYHLTNASGGPRGAGLTTPYARARAGASSSGFMGKAWDGGDIAMRPETWAAVARVLKPGAHLVAFGGTRTHHRVMCAIEDAGFEIRDVLMWVYGSGFPKSKNYPDEFPGMGTALKPAWEPIILARKPLAGSVLDNMRAHGVGMVDIDGCRVPVTDEAYARNASGDRGHDQNRGRAMEFGMTAGRASSIGRWPANVIHDGSDEVVALFPAEAGAAAPVHRRGGDKFRATYGAFKGDIDEQGSTFRGDAGSAARFFYCAKASREDRNEGCEHLQAKPLNWSSGAQSPGAFQSENTDRSSPNYHPTVKPTDLMRWLVRLVVPAGGGRAGPVRGQWEHRQGSRSGGARRRSDRARIGVSADRACAPGMGGKRTARGDRANLPVRGGRLGMHTARVAPEERIHHPPAAVFFSGGRGDDMASEFAEQYRHPLWQKRRLEKLEQAGWKCESCQDDETTLHVHHKHYVKGRKVWEYEDHELEALCEPCHEATHEAKDVLKDVLARIPSVQLANVAAVLIGMFEQHMVAELVERLEDWHGLEVGRLAAVADRLDYVSLVRLRNAAQKSPLDLKVLGDAEGDR